MNKNIPLLLFLLLVALFYFLTKGAYHKDVSEHLTAHAMAGMKAANLSEKEVVFDGLDGVVGNFETEDARNQALAAINDELPAGFIRGRLSDEAGDVEDPKPAEGVVVRPPSGPVAAPTRKTGIPNPIVRPRPTPPVAGVQRKPIRPAPSRPVANVPKRIKPTVEPNVDMPRIKGTLSPSSNPGPAAAVPPGLVRPSPSVVKSAPFPPASRFRATPEVLKALENAAVFFQADMANLDMESVDRLKLAVKALGGAKVPLELVGHAQPGVEDAYQKDLSRRRSGVVRDELVKLGVPARLITSTTAKVAPPAKVSLEYMRQMRRVDIRLK